MFKPETAQALLARLQGLRAEAQPRWGIMSPAQMLRHLQLENELALGRYRGKDYSHFLREKAFKWVIKGVFPLPTVFSKMRLVPAIPELDVLKSGVKVEAFEVEKERLLRQFDELLTAPALSHLHPGIGKMNREEWGFFYAWHTDYHLRQFGL
jgi:hypothetical protein